MQIGRNAQLARGRQSLSMSREAQTLSMSEPPGRPEFELLHSGRDRPRGGSSNALPWTAGVRKYRSFAGCAPNWSIRP